MTFKRLKELKKNKKGFTLIEIIVVVVILAVLMAIAVPAVMKYINEADDAKYMAQARGAFITAEAEVAKEYIKDKTNVANQDYAVSDTVTGNPKVSTITATVDPNGNITKVIVEFDDGTGTTAEVSPNDEVKVIHP